jgi:hypothetical protein
MANSGLVPSSSPQLSSPDVLCTHHTLSSYHPIQHYVISAVETLSLNDLRIMCMFLLQNTLALMIVSLL